MSNCLFCQIAQGKIPSEKIYEDDKVFAFLDINPVNDGHTLVILKEHHPNMYEMPREQFLTLMDAAYTLAPFVKKAVNAEGINIGINNDTPAGQVIFHTHVHIMPRFSYDGYRHWHRDEKNGVDLPSVGEKIRAIIDEPKNGINSLQAKR